MRYVGRYTEDLELWQEPDGTYRLVPWTDVYEPGAIIELPAPARARPSVGWTIVGLIAIALEIGILAATIAWLYLQIVGG